MTRLLFFGRLRDAAGHAERTVTLPEHVATVADLRAWLADLDASLSEALLAPSTRVAIDQVMCRRDDETVRGAREIAFMPPLSGG